MLRVNMKENIYGQIYIRNIILKALGITALVLLMYESIAVVDASYNGCPKVKIVSPEVEEKFYIDTTPKMPEITFKAIVTSEDSSVSAEKFVWDAVLFYNYLDRTYIGNKSYTYQTVKRQEFCEETKGGIESEWTPDFEYIWGGTMVVHADAYIDDDISYSETFIYIRGEQPDVEAVKAEAGAKQYKAVAMTESNCRQFKDDGTPDYGAPAGYGVMKHDPCNYKYLWDWKANVKAGKDHFDKDIQHAKKIPIYVKSHNGANDLGHVPEGMPVNASNVTFFTNEQLYAEAYYFYNTGRSIFYESGGWRAYWIWNVTSNTWEINNNCIPDGAINVKRYIAHYNREK